MHSIKKIFSIVLVFSFIFVLLNQHTFAAEKIEMLTNTDIQIDEDDQLLEGEATEVEISNEIQPFGLVGGGILTARPQSGYAEIGLDLVALQPISVAYLTYSYYKYTTGTINYLYEGVKKTYSLNGRHTINDEFNKKLSKGTYQVKVSGTMYGYNDIPLPVTTFWSKKFTIK